MKIAPILATAALAGTLGLSTIQPAKADTTSTIDTIIGAAAVVAGIAISQNVAHKQQLANTVQGYTPWGATVYADGRVVLPNGQSYYPGNVGQQIACSAQTCTITQNGIAVGYGGYGPTYGYNNGYYNGNNGYYPPANTGYYAPNNGYYAPASTARRTYTVTHPGANSVPVATITRYTRVNNERAQTQRERDDRARHAERSREGT